MAKVTGSGDQRAPHPAVSALAEMARDAVTPPTAAELAGGLEALRSRIDAGRASRRHRLRWMMAGAAAGLLLIGGWRWLPGLWLRTRADLPPVAVARVEGGALLDGGYLSASQHAAIRLLFNEGTEFVLQPQTRGRLREVGRNGAHLDIESGAASFRVTQNPARRWSVEAGPFLVTVKGTVFDVAWDPHDERFDLMLRRGHVTVSGPIVGAELSLHAGQHLVVRLPRAESVITEENQAQPAAAAPPAVSAPAPAPPPPPKRETRRPAALASAGGLLPSGARRWPALLAEGQWDRILAEADRGGLDETVDSVPSEDLFALADAARYRRRVDVARAALLAQRRRFPGASRSQDALFLLGRVEELRGGGAPRAIAFYDDYLAGAPRGPYAAEALGRKMVLTSEGSGAAAARPIAQEYLRRFPDGSYAGTARALAHLP